MIWGLFFKHRTWAPCNHRVDRELFFIQKYSSIKCEATSPTAKAWPKLQSTAESWFCRPVNVQFLKLRAQQISKYKPQ